MVVPYDLVSPDLHSRFPSFSCLLPPPFSPSPSLSCPIARVLSLKGKGVSEETEAAEVLVGPFPSSSSTRQNIMILLVVRTRWYNNGNDKISKLPGLGSICPYLQISRHVCFCSYKSSLMLMDVPAAVYYTIMEKGDSSNYHDLICQKIQISGEIAYGKIFIRGQKT